MSEKKLHSHRDYLRSLSFINLHVTVLAELPLNPEINLEAQAMRLEDQLPSTTLVEPRFRLYAQATGLKNDGQVTRAWHAGLDIARQFQRDSHPITDTPTDEQGLNLPYLLGQLRHIERGDAVLYGLGKAAWNTYATTIHDRLAGLDEKPEVVLPWDELVHSRLRSQRAETRQLAAIALRERYDQLEYGVQEALFDIAKTAN